MDTYQNIPSLPTQSTVAVQQEDGGSWVHGTMAGHGTDKHKGRNYIIQVIKMRCILIRMKSHVRVTPTSGKTTSGRMC